MSFIHRGGPQQAKNGNRTASAASSSSSEKVLPQDDNMLKGIPSHRDSEAWKQKFGSLAANGAAVAETVSEGAGVVLKVGEKDAIYAFVEVFRGKRVRLHKHNVNIDALIGAPFDSFWEIDRDKLVSFDPPELVEYFGDKTADASFVPTGDNSKLYDHNTSQKLSQADIVTMKQELSGKEMVQMLATNSATFSAKTEFSQQKWLKKKKEKYCPRVHLLPAGAQSVCVAYFEKNMDKTLGLRFDTMAQALHLVNPRPDPDALTVVFEQTTGLLTAAVAERLAGMGKCLHLHLHPNAAMHALKFCQLTPQARNSIMMLRLKHVRRLMEERERATNGALLPSSSLTLDSSMLSSASSSSTESTESSSAATASDSSSSSSSSSSSLSSESDAISSNKKQGFNKRHKPDSSAPVLPGAIFMPPTRTLEQVLVECRSRVISSLLIASEGSLDPLAIILIFLLSPSGSFVIYHNAKEPLAALFQQLRQYKLAVNMQLSETWFREYQVLPNRTHPNMNMSGGGGFLLSGIRTDAPDWTVQKIIQTFFANSSSSSNEMISAVDDEQLQAVPIVGNENDDTGLDTVDDGDESGSKKFKH